jgi:hypothetical protein
MNHDEAVRLSLVEKYLLDELPPELRDEFEEHYFDCQECTVDLRATAAFLDAAKEDLKTVPAAKPIPSPAKKPWLAWLWTPAFVVPALAACLAVIAYQNLIVYPHYRGELAQLNAPEILPTLSLSGGSSRGGEMPSITVRSGRPFLLQVDIPTQDRFSSYTCVLYSPSGSPVWQIPVSAESAKDTVPIIVPAANWTAGTYTLVVQGNASPASPEGGVDLERKRFNLTIQE